MGMGSDKPMMTPSWNIPIRNEPNIFAGKSAKRTPAQKEAISQ
jgi:hypothetical protein